MRRVDKDPRRDMPARQDDPLPPYAWKLTATDRRFLRSIKIDPEWPKTREAPTE